MSLPFLSYEVFFNHYSLFLSKLVSLIFILFLLFSIRNFIKPSFLTVMTKKKLLNLQLSFKLTYCYFGMFKKTILIVLA